jgi:hypothetical protein
VTDEANTRISRRLRRDELKLKLRREARACRTLVSIQT